uniref:PX domain-containing protein n=1 Tax=Hyaloperonospora arabidopsidis (strain Emoy2) TaxID=559515 RepID=M4B9V0_HYAAE
MTVDDVTRRHKPGLVACCIEGHKLQKRLLSTKKALDPLRYLPDSNGCYVLFTIAAYFSEDTTTRRHHVYRSYKQLSAMHTRLVKTYPKSHLPRPFPAMRTKKLVPEYINEKGIELTSYLTQILQIPEVKTSQVLHEFLETSHAVDDSSDEDGDEDEDDDEVVPSTRLEKRQGTVMTVRAGQSFSVSLPLGAAGDVASWQFTTKKHNIGFSATFQEKVIRAYSREGADVKFVKGSYCCSRPGTCTLTWDNTYTWSKAKVLMYWAEVEPHKEMVEMKRRKVVAFEDREGGMESRDYMLKKNAGDGSSFFVGDRETRRMGFIEHTRSNAMDPRRLVNSSISLLSKPFVHGYGGKEEGVVHGKTRHLIPRRMSVHAVSIPSRQQDSDRSILPVKAGFLIIQRSVNFHGRNWYRKWFVLDPRKCVLRYYDSEAAAHRGLSSAKLNLTNKHASLAITSCLNLDAAPTSFMFLIRTKKQCWKICASSQVEYGEWESAVSTAILAAQLSRRGSKSKKAMVKAAKSSAIRKDLHSSKFEDKSPKSGETTHANETAVDTPYSSMQPDQPPPNWIETYDGDGDSDNKEASDSDEDDDDESESESDYGDEVCDGGSVEDPQPVLDTIVPEHSCTGTIGSFPDLRSLPLKWKLGLAVLLNVVLIFVRLTSGVIIVLGLFVMDWHLLLMYVRGKELDALSPQKPKKE